MDRDGSSTDAVNIAATAARLIVEEGLEYGPAKRRAAKLLGTPRAALPSNDLVETELRDYIALFCADTQPAELQALRELAAVWMARLAEFRPHLSGAVWRGTATRLSNIHLQLYCDDSKAAEIGLINLGIAYDVAQTGGGKHTVDMLVIETPCRALGCSVPICLSVLGYDDLRGALKGDARGQSERGDLAALQKLLGQST